MKAVLSGALVLTLADDMLVKYSSYGQLRALHLSVRSLTDLNANGGVNELDLGCMT